MSENQSDDFVGEGTLRTVLFMFCAYFVLFEGFATIGRAFESDDDIQSVIESADADVDVSDVFEGRFLRKFAAGFF